MTNVISGQSPQGTRDERPFDDRYELAILTRRSDMEGWSDERFTASLKQLAIRRKDTAAPTQQSNVAISMASAQREVGNATGPAPLFVICDELEKRQETVRITRQADSEGWSDDKTLAALRFRNSIHYELRAKREPIPAEPMQQPIRSRTF